MKKLLLISTTNLFSNPRLVKQLFFFNKKDYDITAIIFNIGYGDASSKEIEKKLPNVSFVKLSALRTPLISWLLSSIISWLSLKLATLFKRNLTINAFAHNKRSYLINKHLNNDKNDYDLIIAHTLGSLYPAYKLGQKKNIAFAFDMEDYHPGESIKNRNCLKEEDLRKFLLKELLPKCTYTSYASPLFIEQSNQLFSKPLKNQFTIHNSFSSAEFSYEQINNGKISLIWYSLTISNGRGLELILPTIEKFKNEVQLTLIGNLDPEFDQKFSITSSSHIIYTNLLPQKKLHQELCKSDIGLSLEQSATDLNRDLCLTNKIISFCQAGNYILATPTSAQKKLIIDYPQLGTIAENLEESLKKIINNISTIRANKKERFSIGNQFSWEQEQQKFAKALKNV